MIYIRTDMNAIIATGHVMRCLAIADAAKAKGERVTFILADNQGQSYIRSRGHEVRVLDSQWNAMENELPALLKLIKEKKIESILIDSYQVTELYLRVLSEYTKVIYMDDLNKFTYCVYMLICYANYWEKMGYEERYPGVNKLLGTKYVPLRQAFSNRSPKKINKKVNNLLLLSGGSDQYNILEQILERIKAKNIETVNVICGRYNFWYEELTKRYKEYKNIQIIQSVDNMEKYMEEADLAISAGGTTLYELCACGTPTISYTFADNQLENVWQFQEDRLIDYAGDVRRDNVAVHIESLVDFYMFEKENRKKRSERMQQLVDGRGTERIVEALLKL